MKSVLKYIFEATVMLYTLTIVCGCSNNQNTKNPDLTNSNDSISIYSPYSGELRNVTFLPYWVTNAQFAGYYVAEEKGIYEKYGININIAQPSSRSSAMLITKKKSGIKTLQDMNGKRAGIWTGYELQPKALFNKYSLDVEIVPIGSSNNLFLMDGVDIINANWFDEYHSIINSGYDPDELNVFFYSDYGLNFLEDGIYCLSEKLKNEPDLCVDFINATLEGWRYAFNHREEAINIVIEYAKRDKLPVNKVHQKWMLDRYQDMYLPEGQTEFNNSLSEGDYLLIANILKANDLIEEVPPYEQFYQPAIKNDE